MFGSTIPVMSMVTRTSPRSGCHLLQLCIFMMFLKTGIVLDKSTFDIKNMTLFNLYFIASPSDFYFLLVLNFLAICDIFN